MSEISTQKILDGITISLRKAYPDKKIFDDEIQQGLILEGFNVILISDQLKQIVGERYRRVPLFDVMYYPEEGREECYKVAETLYTLLDVITLADGDKIRGTDMSFEVDDSVLHFKVQYAHYTMRSKDVADTMDSLKINHGG